MKRPQAEKSNTAQVELHIRRQQVLGPNMIAGNDRVRPADLLVTTGVCLAALAFAAHRGWFNGWLS